MNLVVAIPSRGLIQSRTMDDVLRNVEGYEAGFVFAHGLNIPQSHNEVISQACELLEPGRPNEYIWLVEDDMEIPIGTLDVMLKEIQHKEIVVCDYPCGVDQPTVKYLKGEFAYAGLGCVLIRPATLDKLSLPIFRTDTAYQLQDDELIPYTQNLPDHGLLDIDFWVRLVQAGVEPVVSSVKVGHYFMKRPLLPRHGNTSGSEYEVDLWRL